MVRILDSGAVESLLTDDDVVAAMRDLFLLMSEPGTVGYGRIDLAHPNGWLRALPGFIVPEGVMGFKVLHRTDRLGMRYTIYVHDLDSGELIGLVDGLEVTNIRTGAVSAVGTEHLAAGPVEVAAIVGTGPVARGQLRAIELVRPAAEVRVYARTPQSRRSFIDAMSDTVAGRLIEASSLEEAVDGASLVTLATKSTQPVLRAEHLAPGMHVNSVGPASRDRIEIDPAIFYRFDRVVCDSVELVMDEAGDAALAVEGGHFDPEGAEDLSALVSGEAPGRTSADEVTLFKSVGTGLQDLMVAARLLELAGESGLGTVVDDFVSIKPLPAVTRP